MRIVETVADLRACVRVPTRGECVGLVPTMGNLHDGHLSLIDTARRHGADAVVVSIFVNPLQFGLKEDFATYPRTPEEDHAALAAKGVALVFAPSVAEMSPGGQGESTRVEVPGLSTILCGQSRPGHFVGVATVVTKLFNMVQPDLAVFEEKDYQQIIVIRRMTRDLCLPLEIVASATVREDDGLAMVSAQPLSLRRGMRARRSCIGRCAKARLRSNRANCPSLRSSNAAWPGWRRPGSGRSTLPCAPR